MMRINEIVDHYELWGAKPFVDAEHIYDELQFIQAYCNGVKPIVYCSEILGQLLFGMAYNITETNWRGFTIKKDNCIPHWFIIIYSKRNSWRTKQPILWSMAIQFNDCSNKDKEAMVGILLRNLKESIDL